MRRIWVLCTAMVVLVLAGGAGAAAEERHVLIISIDGLPAEMVDDPRAVMPTLRGLIEAGARAEGMRVSNPSVTWPNHTSMVTGAHPEKHSVLFNGLLIRGGRGEPVGVDPRRDKEELVAVPTLYDIAHEAGLSTAEVNWPGTRHAETIDHGFPDVPEVFAHTTPGLRAELVELGLMEADQEAWSWATTSAASRDEVYTRVAEHVIREHKPRLMLFHLLNVDAAHHTYGAQTPASYSAVAYADACVARVLEALEDAGIRDRTAIFVVADHGFMTVESMVLPNVMLREAGLLEVSDREITAARAQAVTVGGSGIVYFTDPETFTEDYEAALATFREAEGIEHVLEPEEFGDYGLPHPDDNERMGHIVLGAAPGYAFGGQGHGESEIIPVTEGMTRGHHGYLNVHDEMLATFIASGSGIRQGARIEGVVDVRDLAPTAAALLGLEVDEADGRVLGELLE